MSLDDNSRVTIIHCPHGLAIPTRCEQCLAEIDEGLRNLQWEPGSLSTITLERILTDALADLWRDGWRRGTAREWQRRVFRERLIQLVRQATGDEGVI